MPSVFHLLSQWWLVSFAAFSVVASTMLFNLADTVASTSIAIDVTASDPSFSKQWLTLAIALAVAAALSSKLLVLRIRWRFEARRDAKLPGFAMIQASHKVAM